MRILYVTSSKVSTFQAYYNHMRTAGHSVAILGEAEKYSQFTELPKFGYRQYYRLRRINVKLAQNYLRKSIHGALDSFDSHLVHFIHVDETKVIPFISEIPVPVIVTPVGSDIYRFPWTKSCNYSSVHNALRDCDMVLTLSQYARDFLHHAFGVPKSKIQVKFWGIDCENIDRVVAMPSIEWNFADDEFIILLPRGLRNVFRPILHFLAIVKPLTNICPNVRIVMLGWGGDSEIKRTARNILQKTGAEEYVTWVEEFVPHENMLRLIKASSIIVSLAETDEMCAAILEAMYLGAIPIVSRIPSYEREFEDQSNLIMVDNGRPDEILSAIAHCVENFDDISGPMRSRNRTVVETKYNTSTNMRAIENMYRELIDSRHSGTRKG